MEYVKHQNISWFLSNWTNNVIYCAYQVFESKCTANERKNQFDINWNSLKCTANTFVVAENSECQISEHLCNIRVEKMRKYEQKRPEEGDTKSVQCEIKNYIESIVYKLYHFRIEMTYFFLLLNTFIYTWCMKKEQNISFGGDNKKWCVQTWLQFMNIELYNRLNCSKRKICIVCSSKKWRKKKLGCKCRHKYPCEMESLECCVIINDYNAT